MENVKSNEDITDITEVLEMTQNSWRFDRTDVSGYKWKLVSDNQNEPSQVHFYKEDMNDIWSVNLSIIFNICLKEYLHHLDEEEKEEKDRVEREIQQKKDKLFDEKVDEVIESYELFLKQKVKDEINDRMKNEENEYFDECLKYTLTNIRVILDDNSVNRNSNSNGVHLGVGNNKQNRIWIDQEWYLENFEKLNQIILSYDPDFNTCSSPLSQNEHGYNFINIDGNPQNTWKGRRFKWCFYDKLILLHRKMKKSPIGYWKS